MPLLVPVGGIVMVMGAVMVPEPVYTVYRVTKRGMTVSPLEVVGGVVTLLETGRDVKEPNVEYMV